MAFTRATFVPTPIGFDDDPGEVVSVVAEEVVTDVVVGRPTAQTFTVMPTKTHLASSGNWTWQQLRDYVVGAIVSHVGAFPRNPITEASIFKGFMERWGDKAEAIARYAVEVQQCWWRSAPLSVQRFCLGQDPYFASVIAAQV